ncbi:MAG: hypothetical protein LVO36_00275 [Nitrosopumilus sp. (ex Thoosa mismalolli)]|nr:hypothetical protein [Nitrosopumilus sp. (ex Thoosa mismalolli)]
MKLISLAICLVSLTPFVFAETQKENWINLRGEEVSVFSTSVEPLLVRGYFEQKTIGDIAYSSQIDLEEAEFDFDDIFGLTFVLSEFSDTSLLLLTVPRDVLDATFGYDEEKEDFKMTEFVVLVSESEKAYNKYDLEEISYKEISSSKTHRTILLEIEPGDSILEVVGTCIPENCHMDY